MKRRGGFTLVELVVIILILGILAGVAAPKMFNTSASASENGLKQTLTIIRDAIELYTAQNNGAYPPSDATGTTFKPVMQDFIRGAFPKCPVGTRAGLDTIKAVTGPCTPDGTTAWMYSTDTGEFICNSGGTSTTGVLFSAF
jgi:general secretion pathway protein G